jgi:hypothetical protein
MKSLKTTGILPILLIITLLALFSETVRTLPVGALSEVFFDLPYEVPRLNSEIIEKKLLEKSDYRRIHKEIIFKKPKFLNSYVTLCLSPVTYELRNLGFLKIISLAEEVL